MLQLTYDHFQPFRYIQSTCATSGEGLYEGLDWLSNNIANKVFKLNFWLRLFHLLHIILFVKPHLFHYFNFRLSGLLDQLLLEDLRRCSLSVVVGVAAIALHIINLLFDDLDHYSCHDAKGKGDGCIITALLNF